MNLEWENTKANGNQNDDPLPNMGDAVYIRQRLQLESLVH